MYSIYAGLIVGILVGLLLWTRSQYRDGQRFAMCTLFGAVVGGVIGVFAGFLMWSTLPAESKTDTYQLVAMREVDGASGVFVWGSGSVSTGQTYSCMVVKPDGLKPWSTPAVAEIRVRELPELHNDGRLVVHYMSKRMDLPRAAWALTPDSDTWGYLYEFDVPVGSVVHQFKAN